MAQKLKAFAAYTEGLNSVPSTYTGQLTTTRNYSSGGFDTLSWLPWSPVHSCCTYRRIYTQAHKRKEK